MRSWSGVLQGQENQVLQGQDNTCDHNIKQEKEINDIMSSTNTKSSDRIGPK